MYQSGSMVSYQSPSSVYAAGAGSYCRELFHAEAGVGVLIPSTVTMLPAPSSIDEATSLPTAKQWDAKHGCYLIPRLTNFDGPFNGPDVTDTVDAMLGTMALQHPTTAVDAIEIAPNLLASGPSVGISHSTAARIDTTPLSATVGNLFSAGPLMPYSATGVHFTGLSPESTFTFVATWYIQCSPLPGSPLATMVVPTPAYDPRVYEIYTKVMRAVPLATYKDDNDFGTWFRKVMGMVSRVAGPVGAALGVPGAGKTIGTVAGIASNLPRRKPQPKQPAR